MPLKVPVIAINHEIVSLLSMQFIHKNKKDIIFCVSVPARHLFIRLFELIYDDTDNAAALEKKKETIPTLTMFPSPCSEKTKAYITTCAFV